MTKFDNNRRLTLIGRLFECGIVAALYILTARLGQTFAVPPGNVTAVWLPSGIMLALVLLRGGRIWPGIFLGAFCGNIWAYIDFNSFSTIIRAVTAATFNGTGDVIAAVGGGFLIRKLTGTDDPLKETAHIKVFIFYGACLGSLVSALLGVTSLLAAGFILPANYGFTLFTWFTGDAVGVLVMTPVIITLYCRKKEKISGQICPLEYLLFFLLLTVATLFGLELIQGFETVHVSLYSVTPLLMWSLMRMKRFLTYSALLTTFLLAAVATSLKLGPFYHLDVGHSLIGLQLFASILTVTIMMVSALLCRQRQGELELRRALTFSQTLVDTANAMLVGLNLNGEIIIFNHAAEELTGYGRDEVMGKNWFQLFLPESERGHVLEAFQQLKTGEDYLKKYENYILTKSGEKRMIAWRNSTVFEEGQLRSTISFGLDITPHVETETKLQGSLRNKETMIREIYHRVKNNLIVVQSLLGLQAGLIDDPKVKEYFEESRNRLKTMSMIHERLHGSGNFETIALSEYLHSLMYDIYESYKRTSREVALTLDVSDIQMPVDQMTPLGLIFNELVSNVFKHAFPESADIFESPANPGGRKRELLIAVRPNLEGMYELIVTDNGIGIPEYVDIYNTSSLGLQLVTALTSQLDGHLEYSSNNSHKGCRFVISFLLMER